MMEMQRVTLLLGDGVDNITRSSAVDKGHFRLFVAVLEGLSVIHNRTARMNNLRHFLLPSKIENVVEDVYVGRMNCKNWQGLCPLPSFVI